MLSIIIPIANEAHNLRRLLPDLHRKFPETDIIVVDGGSVDGSPRVVEQFPFARLVVSPRGRARQMNAGAQEGKGEVLLFLHGDTLLPERASEAVRAALADPQTVGGRFEFRLDNPGFVFQIITHVTNFLRSRPTWIATGDQALFVRRKIFDEMGGYPDIALMEDVEFTKALTRRGNLACLPLPATTSARKWERDGVLWTVLLMLSLRVMHFLRVDPTKLCELYYGYAPPAK
ncbi:MAG: TIGR04283 family arsenosugar biosynthesis glycosyltransferase [Candidatus Methylomirabilales bacterium]